MRNALQYDNPYDQDLQDSRVFPVSERNTAYSSKRVADDIPAGLPSRSRSRSPQKALGNAFDQAQVSLLCILCLSNSELGENGFAHRQNYSTGAGQQSDMNDVFQQLKQITSVLYSDIPSLMFEATSLNNEWNQQLKLCYPK